MFTSHRIAAATPLRAAITAAQRRPRPSAAAADRDRDLAVPPDAQRAATCPRLVESLRAERSRSGVDALIRDIAVVRGGVA